MPDKMRIEVASNQEVTALVYAAGKPDLAGVTVILGHGAGADQRSDFMTRFATGLAARGMNVRHPARPQSQRRQRRPIPQGRSANRSPSAIEPVSAPPKWKLENGEQRP